ncbi:Transposase [Sedimentisphaera salicampi]|nr:Transposase [Sedimentisphaera salicampi]
MHWRSFLDSLVARGLRGVKYIVSDDHKGIRAAKDSIFNGVIWQRCQFHLQRNAQAYVPRKDMQKQVSQEIKDVFNAPNADMAKERLDYYVNKYADAAPKLSEWMEENLPEGLAVFELPKHHRKRLRTTNMLERLHEEINRRTRVAGIFPNEESLIRLISAIEIEISEDWITGRKYLNMDNVTEDECDNANSYKNRIYRNNLA